MYVLASPAIPAAGQFEFTILGLAGQTYEVDASSNLVDWFPIGTTNAPADSFNFIDFSATNPSRFYSTRQGL